MKLSIIIAAYNVEKYIVKTLCSLKNQTNQDFEAIIIDDGSTDCTYNIVNDYIKQYKLINFKILSKCNGGVSSVRNRGIIESYGDYIIFLDGDDYISNDLVDTIIRTIYTYDSDVICWGYNLVREDGFIEMDYFKKYKFNDKSISGIQALIRNHNNEFRICTGSSAFKRNLLIDYNIKYTENCINGEDQEFTYKCLSRANQVVLINEVLTFYLKRNGSLTNSYNIKRFDSIYAFDRIANYLESLSNSIYDKILIEIRCDMIIKNYLGNLNNSLRYLLDNSKSNRNRKRLLQQLFSDIDIGYPNLTKDIKLNMKNYKGSSIFLYFIIKIFLISPNIYSYLIILKDKLKK